MNDYLETKRFKLTGISPIHIKSGEADKYYGQGFIRLPYDIKNIYVIDTPKLQTLIFEKGGLNAVNDFSKKIITDNKFNLYNFLKEIGIELNKNNITSISKGIVLSYKTEQNKNKFIADGFEKNFIPGSSIKGALKTAVLFEMLKNKNNYLYNLVVDQLDNFDEIKNIIAELNEKLEKENDEKIKSKIKYEIKNKRNLLNKNKERFASDIINKYIQDTLPIEFPVNTNRSKNYTQQNKDFFRAVKISDSTDFVITESKVRIMTIRNSQPQWKFYNGQPMEIKAEIMYTETIIEISIDHEILDSFSNKTNIPFKNIDELINLAQKFANKQWEFEKAYLNFFKTTNFFKLDKIKRFYSQNRNPTLRVGWATGMLGTTLGLLLETEQLQDLRDTVYGERINQPAPKSRRFIVGLDGQPEYPLGWLKLEQV